MDSEYSVHLYSTPLPLPLSMFVHAYLVTMHCGNSNRYEIIKPGRITELSPHAGRVFKNLLPTETGFSIILRRGHSRPHAKRWPVKRHGSVHGPEGSPAHALYTFIETDGIHEYPHKDNYSMVLGPNSNSFIQWVVNQVPGTELILPWNAWGKGFFRK